MNKHPKIRLSRLRDIGWRCWDPIGLAGLDGGWENSAAADEYDGYLMEFAGMVRNDAGDDAAAHPDLDRLSVFDRAVRSSGQKQGISPQFL
jgi:hypothetical protein